MLRTFNDLARHTINATDGDVGSVRDVYFDDGTWTVRYLAVDAGDPLSGRRTLVPPMSIRSGDPAQRTLRVALTMRQVRSSPDVNGSSPLSRKVELALAQHYGYSPDWVSAGARPAGVQSATALIGHAVRTEEGDIGRVEDILIDDKVWAIRYMIVDAKRWWPGKKVFVSPRWLAPATWDGSATLSCIALAVGGGARRSIPTS